MLNAIEILLSGNVDVNIADTFGITALEDVMKIEFSFPYKKGSRDFFATLYTLLLFKSGTGYTQEFLVIVLIRTGQM